MIQIQITKLTLGILAQLLIQIVTLARNSAHSEVIMANGAMKALEAMADKLNNSLFKSAYSGMGQDVKNADKRRTTLYSSLKKLLQGMSPFGGENADAASVLVKEMEIRPAITSLNYGEKSRALDKVCANLATSKSRELAEIAGVTNNVDALKEAQKDFNYLMTTQIETNSDLIQADSATELRPEAEVVLRNALSIIWGMRFDPEWVDFYHDVLKAVQAAKNTLRDLSGKKDQK